MKAIFNLVLLGLATSLCLSCGLFPDSKESSDDPDKTLLGEVLVRQEVDPTQNEVIVIVEDKMKIVFPGGCVDSAAELTVTEVISAPGTSTDEYKIHNAYEVTFGEHTTFAKPVKISILYDPEVLDSETTAEDIQAAYLNDNFGRWSFYRETQVDMTNHRVTFETEHLTTLGFGEFISSGGYTGVFLTEHFKIYYTHTGSSAPMDNQTYSGSEIQPWYDLDGPEAGTFFYVQDLGHWLEEAFVAYRDEYALELPREGLIRVYVKSLTGSDGEYGSISGVLYLNNKMQKSSEVPELTFADMLRSAAAHELFHYVQDYYYVLNKAGYNLWWLEATATQADKLVWGDDVAYPESYAWSLQKKSSLPGIGLVLSNNISKSWDDCDGSPFHYVAGCFLHYLIHYDDEVNLDLPAVLKAAGSDFDTSYIRTVLDDFLQTNHATELGDEFAKYVKWLFEGNVQSSATTPSHFRLPYNFYSMVSPASGGDCCTAEYPLILSTANPEASFNQTLPYLSARIIKIKNSDDERQSAIVKVAYLPEDVVAYLYGFDDETKSLFLEKELATDDEVVIALPIGTEKKVKDLLIINRSSSEELTPDIQVELKDLDAPVLNRITPEKAKPGEDITLVGLNFGTTQAPSSSVTLDGVSLSVGSWSSTEITCSLPADAKTGYVAVTVNGKRSDELYYPVGDSSKWPASVVVNRLNLFARVTCDQQSQLIGCAEVDGETLTGSGGIWTGSDSTETETVISEACPDLDHIHVKETETNSWSVSIKIVPMAHETKDTWGLITVETGWGFTRVTVGDDAVTKEYTENKAFKIEIPWDFNSITSPSVTVNMSKASGQSDFAKYVLDGYTSTVQESCEGTREETSSCGITEDNIESLQLSFSLTAVQ